MAPSSSRPKPRHPQLQITLPRGIQHAHAGGKKEYPLTVDDFRLTWLDYIKKQDGALYREVTKRSLFTIMDIRTSSTRKIWRLNCTVKQFIDSFGRTLQSYKAVIGTQPPNTHPPAPAAAQASSTSMPNGSGSNLNRSQINGGVTPRASNGFHSVSTTRGTMPVQDVRTSKPPCYSPNNTRSSSRNKPGESAKVGPSTPSPPKRKPNNIVPPIEPPKRANMNNGEFSLKMSANGAGPSNGTQTPGVPRTQFSFPVVDVDDSASMAPTVDSQDSQDDLREAGVKIEEVKADVINRLKNQCDNNMMLRMRLELQGLMKNKKYFPTMRRLPYTSSMLQYVFRLNEND